LSLAANAFFKTDALIGGQWVSADDGTTFSVANPANGEVIAHVANCGVAETTRAIAAAGEAWQDWRGRPAKERSSLLRAWFELINENKDQLARLLTLEQGKPLAEAAGEIAYGASYVEWFAEEAKRIYGDTIAAPDSSKRITVLKQPIGVVACITPWNFPNAMLTRKIAPALATGCTVVCKPANETPLSALAIGQLSVEAGIPPGVINMLCGKTEEIGQTITSSHVVRKLTFTGSTAVGKKLAADCAATMKRTTMELGGNAPFIVFEDADIDAAVAGALASKYRNAGQTCVCANRFLVHRDVYEAFSTKLATAVRALKVGDGLEDVAVGPLIHARAAANVESLVQDAVKAGASILAGCTRHGAGYMTPGVLVDVDPDMRICREEIFGPVAPLIKFDSEEEALALANDSDAGLAAYFYTQSIGRIHRVSEALEYGIVGINDGVVSNEMAPFGGMKESGNGREGSKYGLDDYLEIKYINLGNLS
jgi:succinate-semialdehyde dehydrogenase/glutarate-semialdehyde dehydrogenase